MENLYEQAKNLITSREKFHICLGLDRVSKVLELLKNPQKNLRIIHVAGTNGKGSVCAILSKIFTCAGYKTGLYTSPHILEYTERIKINQKDISKNDFAQLIFEISDIAKKNEIYLTEFELLTVAAYKYFSDKETDICVIETGLGGRLDATNAIEKNLLSVITSISLDHTDRLGNTIEKIAFEKAGIIKENCPIVTSEGYEAIKDTADEKNSLLLMTAPFADTTNLSLKGTYQQENLALALAALKLVYPEIPQTTVDEGLKNVKHPCRFQIIEDKNIIIDGAHNPNGITGLRESLDFYYPDKYRRFVFGCLKNKDYKKMMEILFEQGDEIYFYHFNNPNSCTVKELQAVCPHPSKEFKGLNELPQKENTITIFCGSFYMLQEIVEAAKIL